jgi:hypothetical protein
LDLEAVLLLLELELELKLPLEQPALQPNRVF